MVDGGALKVRVPREPKLKPPPKRASAEELARGIISKAAKARAAPLAKRFCRAVLDEEFMSVFANRASTPRQHMVMRSHSLQDEPDSRRSQL